MEVKEISESLRFEIETLVDKILARVFLNFGDRKKRVSHTTDAIRFACPYCGDSQKDEGKKRGWLYWNSAYFHCFNCETHKPILTYLKDFDEEIENLEDRTLIHEIFRTYQHSYITAHTSFDYSIIEDVGKFAISKDKLFMVLDLHHPTSSDPLWKELEARYITHRVKHLAVNKKNDKLYILNLLDEDHIIGFQIRNYGGIGSRFQNYPLAKIWKEIFKVTEDVPALENLSRLSTYYNFFHVDFSRPFTLFEGPIDSYFMKNSLSTSGVTKDTRFFDELDTCRYFYDNDKAGLTKMIEKLKEGKYCFLWHKFIKQNNLEEYNNKGLLKDLNDIVKLAMAINKPIYSNLDQYFSNNPLDLIYL